MPCNKLSPDFCFGAAPDGIVKLVSSRMRAVSLGEKRSTISLWSPVRTRSPGLNDWPAEMRDQPAWPAGETSAVPVILTTTMTGPGACALRSGVPMAHHTHQNAKSAEHRRIIFLGPMAGERP